MQPEPPATTISSPADLEVRELDGENDERLPEGSVQLLLDLIERCPDGAASVPSASVLPDLIRTDGEDGRTLFAAPANMPFVAVSA